MLITPDHTPDDALENVHDELKRAGVDRKHKFRFFSVATISADSLNPRSRMVVLRSFDSDWYFEFYTDIRSDKVSEVKANPFIEALFWDPSKRVQVRIHAAATIHHRDKLSKERWSKVQGDAQKAYASPIKPGAAISYPGDAHQWPAEMDDRHFAVIRCNSSAIKVLQISGMEHVALEYTRSNGHDGWMGAWIAP